MRRTLLACLTAGLLLMVPMSVLGSEPPVTRHLHWLTTPNDESHVIAGGVTYHAPCVAFLNLHEIVHETVFGTPITGALRNPNGPLVPQGLPELGTCTPDP